jgi:hypothetical protein
MAAAELTCMHEDKKSSLSQHDPPADGRSRIAAEQRERRRSGVLYGWGMSKGQSLPVAASAIDKDGDCVYPAKLLLPETAHGLRFVKIAADMGIFAALDLHGGLWIWGSERSGFPTKPTRAVQGLLDVDVGSSAVFALTETRHVLRLTVAKRDCLAAAGVGKSPKVAEDTRRGVSVSKGRVTNGDNASSHATHTAIPTATPTSSLAHPQDASASAVPRMLCARIEGHVVALPPDCRPVRALSACQDTVALLCEDGSLWADGNKWTCGHRGPGSGFARLTIEGQVTCLTIGSRTAAASTTDGTVWLWGEGLQGTLATGIRTWGSPIPVRCELFKELGLRVTALACTRGQPEPKRIASASLDRFLPGQEGPRVHAVTHDGGLWICGTTHKGLAANHLFKVMSPHADVLSFSRVGGAAVDASAPAVWTGAAEEISSDPVAAARGLGMQSVADFGRDGNTHYLDTARIIDTTAAHIHSLALADDGRLFAWGCGSDGRLGLHAYLRGPGGGKRRLKCYVSSPSVVESLADKRVVGIALGRYWSFALVDE